MWICLFIVCAFGGLTMVLLSSSMCQSTNQASVIISVQHVICVVCMDKESTAGQHLSQNKSFVFYDKNNFQCFI
jgi:hypothetical protein